MNKTTLSAMFDNLLHIGNKTTYWNPKMRSSIHGSSNGVHVINLIETTKKLEAAKKIILDHTTEGKSILFVATKLQGRDSFAKLAEETGHHFVTEKWVPGLLTNFKTIKKRIGTYMSLLKDSTNGGFDMLTKKEKAAKMLELEKLDRAFRGLKTMRSLPDMVFIVDGAYEDQVGREATKLGIEVIAMLNTNGDPDLCTHYIPVNTNAVNSLDYIAKELKDSVKAPKAPERKAGFKRTPNKRPISGLKRADSDKMSGNLKDRKVTAAPAPKAEEVKTEAPKKEAVKAPVAKAAPAKKASGKGDDLTKIEGIGPKIAETLVAAGVATFADLSTKKPAEISEIITSVRGSHVPDTWPKQAWMAAEDKWDELKKWQDEMDGGKV